MVPSIVLFPYSYASQPAWLSDKQERGGQRLVRESKVSALNSTVGGEAAPATIMQSAVVVGFRNGPHPGTPGGEVVALRLRQ